MVSVGFESQVLRLQIQDTIVKGSSEDETSHQILSAIDVTLLALSLARFLTFAATVLIFWVPQSSTDDSSTREADPLLPDGMFHCSPTYGTNPSRPPAENNASSSMPKDAQANEWTDYVVGFRYLFPFLWYASEFNTTNHSAQLNPESNNMIY